MLRVTMMIVAAHSLRCHALLGQHPIQQQRRNCNTNHHHHHIMLTTTTSTLLSATPSPSPPSSKSINSNNPLTNSTLIYFPLPGRGEAIRLALTISNIPFNDHRVPFRSWGNTKPTTPWGTLPILELSDSSDGDGGTTTRLGQSRSILRFVGKYTGLYPTTITSDDDDDININYLHTQRIDELMDALEDLGAAISGIGIGLEKDEMEAVRLLDATTEGGMLYGMLTKIDTFIQEMGQEVVVVGDNDNEDDTNYNYYYAVGNSLTIADLLTFTSMGRLAGGVYSGIPSTVCDPFQNIQKVRRVVGRDPRVMDWYDERGRVGKLTPAEQVLSDCRDL